MEFGPILIVNGADEVGAHEGALAPTLDFKRELTSAEIAAVVMQLFQKAENPAEVYAAAVQSIQADARARVEDHQEGLAESD